MSISDNYSPIKQLGNGSTVDFSGSWPIFNSSYIRVYLESVATGVQTLQVLNTNYTLVFSSTGFTVTFLSAPTSANYVVIGRDIALDQTDPYTTSKGFQGTVIEDSLDKLTGITQDLHDSLARAIKFALGSSFSGITLPDPEASKIWVWNADGDGIEYLAAADIDLAVVSAFFETLLGAEDAAALLTLLGVSAFAQTLLDDANAAASRTTLGLGTAATQNTGTSGANVPLMNGANTWSGQQSFSTSAIDLQVGQIAFPATQNPSAGANTLDDYEEGTFTSAFTSGAGTVTINSSFQTGYYTKVGRQVTVTGEFRVQSVSGQSGLLTLTGLPFTSANATGATTAVAIDPSSLTAGGTTSIVGRILQNSTAIQMFRFAAGAHADLADVCQAGSDFIISTVYNV